MNKTEITQSIQSCTLEFTDIVPEIYFREMSSNVRVVWADCIPDEETTLKIEGALKQFGKIIPNHFREEKLVSFVIIIP